MYISKEDRIKALRLRIAKLSVDGATNFNLIKKAERQIRRLSNT